MQRALFQSEPPRGFTCILADPAWPEYGGGGRGAQNHYDLMSVQEIRDLAPMVRDVAAPNAHLWMWVTDTYLHDAMHIGSAWGFRYIRTFAWVKLKKDGDVHPGGIGQYGRGAHELLLLFVRGSLLVPPDRRSSSVIMAKRGRHSAKPRESYDLIEKATPGPRLEMFCRKAHPGWQALGNETSGGNLADDLRELANALPQIETTKETA